MQINRKLASYSSHLRIFSTGPDSHPNRKLASYSRQWNFVTRAIPTSKHITGERQTKLALACLITWRTLRVKVHATRHHKYMLQDIIHTDGSSKEYHDIGKVIGSSIYRKAAFMHTKTAEHYHTSRTSYNLCSIATLQTLGGWDYCNRLHMPHGLNSRAPQESSTNKNPLSASHVESRILRSKRC